jgi:SAM-dependent methyltransferase
MSFWSYRRTVLDSDLEKSKKYMKGIVLDVGGGRKRGKFKKPDDIINLDIMKEFCPNIMGDVHHIPLKNNSVDCIICTELLEHIEFPESVIKELSRILKRSGKIIISVPFNTNIHADPYDFQRLTGYKLRRILENDFEIKIIKKQGLYFTVLGDMIKRAAININSGLRYLFYSLIPILDLLVKLDNSGFVKNSKYLSSFTTGFFVVAVKKRVS